MVDPNLLAYAHMTSHKTLEQIAEKKCKRFGLSPSAMLARLRALAENGIIAGRDGRFHEDEVLEAAGEYRPFMTGNVKDLRTLLEQKKPEPDALELADGEGEVPKGGDDGTAPLPAPASEGRREAELTADGTKPSAAPEAVEEPSMLKKADTGGMSEGRLAVLRAEAASLAGKHAPTDYESPEEFMLGILCTLERKGIISGGQQAGRTKGPFYVEMIPHAEYVPIRTSGEFAEFERDLFRIAEKISGGGPAGLVSYAGLYDNLKRIFQDPAKIPLGKVFVTKWTRRMAKNMDATKMRPLDEDPDYMITTVALRTMTTSICRIICGMENLDWTGMKRHLHRRLAPEPMAEAPAPQPQKAKRPYRRKNADFYSSGEEIAAEHKSLKFRTKAILEVVRGLEEAGEIRKTGGRYTKAETREKLREFLERHCSENEVVERISREFGLSVQGAGTKFAEFRKSHKKRVEDAMKHGAYDREAVGELLESYRSVFEKYSGSKRAERRETRARQKRKKETDVRKGKKLIKAAIRTMETLEAMKEAQKNKLIAAMGCDVFAALRTAKHGLNEGCGFVPRDQFRALLDLGKGVKESGIQVGRLGITPEDIENIAYIAKAKLSREGPSIRLR